MLWIVPILTISIYIILDNYTTHNNVTSLHWSYGGHNKYHGIKYD